VSPVAPSPANGDPRVSQRPPLDSAECDIPSAPLAMSASVDGPVGRQRRRCVDDDPPSFLSARPLVIIDCIVFDQPRPPSMRSIRSVTPASNTTTRANHGPNRDRTVPPQQGRYPTADRTAGVQTLRRVCGHSHGTTTHPVSHYFRRDADRRDASSVSLSLPFPSPERTGLLVYCLQNDDENAVKAERRADVFK
jgi:hypothetical protein